MKKQPIRAPDSRLLSIDPGLYSTGWAFWKYPREGGPPTQSGFLESKTGCMIEQTMNVIDMITALLPTPIHLAIEGQDLRKGRKSQSSAARGDLFKLSQMSGAVMGAFLSDVRYSGRSGVSVRWVQAIQWKGTMPDFVAAERVFEYTDLRYDCVDEMCAVGIGLHVAGFSITDGP